MRPTPHLTRLRAEVGSLAPLTLEAVQAIHAGAKQIHDTRLTHLCDGALRELHSPGDNMNNDQKIAAEREGFAAWAGAVPADLHRRVRENPKIAIDLLVALTAAQTELNSEGISIPIVDAAIAAATGPDLSYTRAHYAKQLAQIGAERTGEELLPEHLA